MEMGIEIFNNKYKKGTFFNLYRLRIVNKM
jgi:hypothetical protein